MTMNNRINRRGVTLLIVLSLMTMFALLVVAFMVITTQARRAAEHAAQAVLDSKDVSTETDVAIQKLLIGDKLESVIGPHSILENLYGHPNTENTENLKGSFGAIDIANSGADYIKISYIGSFDNNLIGNVLTIPAIEKSTFIIGNDGTKFLLARNGMIDADFTGDFIINSPAFSGTGPGFNSNAASGTAALEGKDDEVDPDTGKIDFGIGSGKPLALRPNILAPETSGDQLYKTYLKKIPVLMNPDYTAPDYRSMFLAWNDVQDNSPALPKWIIRHIIPSFHRPQLVKYHFDDVRDIVTTWDSKYPSAPPDVTELRKVVMRPLPTDHPKFTGSNPAATSNDPKYVDLFNFLEYGPWDVDNDGDGIADGVWLDVGLGTVTIGNKKYKKLVSYYVLDMDGRLNVNVHGNTFPVDNITSSGPAEVRLDLGLKAIETTNDFLNIVNGISGSEDKGRYGDDKAPGAKITMDSSLTWNNYKLMGINPLAYGYLPTAFSISGDLSNPQPVGGIIPDLWGKTLLEFDEFGNRKMPTSSNIYASNPYLMNPYTPTGDDKLFDISDLQYLVRSVGDVDYATLPKRLRSLLGESASQYELSKYRLFLGTRSSDIPVFNRLGGEATGNRGLYDYIDKVIYHGTPTPTVTIAGVTIKKADALWNLLPEEIRRGEKVNLNRLTLRSDWTDVDSMSYSDLLKAKAKFAQEIYYLLCVLCYDQINSTTTFPYEGLPNIAAVYARLAQWSVNLVDFIDPDAIMTPFVFSTDPFTDLIRNEDTYKDDGSAIEEEGQISKILNTTTPWTQPTSNSLLIWGMEKPEVALTKTFAVHNRCVADSLLKPDVGSGVSTSCDCGADTRHIKTGVGGACNKKHDDTFDQVREQESSLFVELYRQGDPKRNAYPADGLGLDATTKLNLAKKVYGGTDYVWRLVIGEKANSKPSDSNDVFHELKTKGLTYSFQSEIVPERFIWFGDDSTGIPSEASSAINFYSTDPTQAELEPDKYLVIGPDSTKISFQSKPVNDSNLTFGTPTDVPGTYIELTSTSLSNAKTMIAKEASGTGVNVTFPTGGYAGPAQEDTPHVESPETDGLGTITGYKAIFLQRLADPTRAYNSETNPYITVDWNMIDLHVINSEKDEDGLEYTKANDSSMVFGEDTMKFAIRQWGYSNWTTPPASPNLWDRSFDKEWTGSNTAEFDGESQSTSNKLIFGQRAKDIDNADKFVHFPWHDAPLANTYELMLVPACTQGQFGFKFHDTEIASWESSGTSLGTTGMRFAGTTDGTDDGGSPYLNFFGGDLNLSRLFDYVRVPSKFTGTISGWIPGTVTNPDTPIYAMREPGKINLNTATAPAWEALKGNDGRAWHDYVVAKGLYKLRNDFTNNDPSGFLPFRSPQAVNLVPPDVTLSSAADATLLRSNLLELDTSLDQNPYTALENYMRLSDMTTTRSNVFAVWVTVGYFEAEHFANAAEARGAYGGPINLGHIVDDNMFNAVYPDGYILGAEKGLDNGTVKRHRAFYLIDRSTPVGFRRGDNTTNFKDVIVNSKVLE